MSERTFKNIDDLLLSPERKKLKQGCVRLVNQPAEELLMPIPFTLQRLDHVVLRVRNMASMLAFYCDVLGCTVEKRQDAIGLLQLRAGDSLIDLVDVTGKLGRMGGAAPRAVSALSAQRRA